MSQRTCSVEDCERPEHAGDLCRAHYDRRRRTGVLGGKIEEIIPRGGPCKVAGCTETAWARGWCSTHYQRWRTTGTTEPPPKRERGSCSVDGCDEPHNARGWCKTHYARWRRRNSPTPPPLNFPTPEDRLAVMHESAPGGCMIYTGPLNRGGYGVINAPEMKARGTVLVHRFVWWKARGPVPEGLEIDHVCRNRACFNLDHLRVVTRAENLQNASAAPKGGSSTSGVRGVWWSNRRNKWEAGVYLNKQLVYHEFFTDLDEAAAAVKAARLRLLTHNEMDRIGPRPAA